MKRLDVSTLEAVARLIYLQHGQVWTGDEEHHDQEDSPEQTCAFFKRAGVPIRVGTEQNLHDRILAKLRLLSRGCKQGNVLPEALEKVIVRLVDDHEHINASQEQSALLAELNAILFVDRVAVRFCEGVAFRVVEIPPEEWKERRKEDHATMTPHTTASVMPAGHTPFQVDPGCLTGDIPVVFVGSMRLSYEGFEHLGSVILTPEQEEEFRRCRFNSRLPINVTAVPVRETSQLVTVGTSSVALTEKLFLIFLRLVVEVGRGGAGWVSRDEFLDEGYFRKSNENQTRRELRQLFHPGTGRLDEDEFIEYTGKQWRLSTHRAYIMCNKKLLLEHHDHRIRTLAANLPDSPVPAKPAVSGPPSDSGSRDVARVPLRSSKSMDHRA